MTGIGDVEKMDLHVVGIIHRESGPEWDYADIIDEDWCSMLAIPLLDFEGKRVEISVRVLE